jgi:hypothetical protein
MHDGVRDRVRSGVRDRVRSGMRDGVRGPEIVGIWSAWMNLLMSRECKGPIVDMEAVQGNKVDVEGATWTSCYLDWIHVNEVPPGLHQHGFCDIYWKMTMSR